jgi:hypothetical protein
MQAQIALMIGALSAMSVFFGTDGDTVASHVQSHLEIR